MITSELSRWRLPGSDGALRVVEERSVGESGRGAGTNSVERFREAAAVPSGRRGAAWVEVDVSAMVGVRSWVVKSRVGRRAVVVVDCRPLRVVGLAVLPPRILPDP
ncbi:MAG: hypothetical protein MUC91_05035, partial [Verrucomicrobia bacterium]|nr:hypothetical protein [Verrucomicrobiota bacterium]